jgi:hypothetical protein
MHEEGDEGDGGEAVNADFCKENAKWSADTAR